MCICGWELVALACALPCLVVVYGAVDRRITSQITLDTSSARHRGGEPVASLRKRHRVDELPYYPASTKPIRP